MRCRGRSTEPSDSVAWPRGPSRLARRTLCVPGVSAFRSVHRAAARRHRRATRRRRPRRAGWSDGMSAPCSRAQWLTDALVAPPTEEIAATELARLRGDLARDLQALGADLPAGERLQIDAFKVLVAHRHPDRCMSTDDTFVPSPRPVSSCRGRRGCQPLCPRIVPRSGRRRGRGVGGGARGPVAESPRSGVRAPWWAQWYAGLPRGGRAVVARGGRHVGDTAAHGGGMASGFPAPRHRGA